VRDRARGDGDALVVSGKPTGLPVPPATTGGNMMLMRFDPFRDFDRVGQAFPNRASAMSLDAYREGDRYVIRFDLPGVAPDKIDVVVEKNVLTVRAERNWQPAENQEVLITERPQGTFMRQLFLGEGLEADRIDARYELGVLTITIPVAEQARPHSISITSSDSGSKVDTAGEVREATASTT
jgi:HSP20 family protein